VNASASPDPELVPMAGIGVTSREGSLRILLGSCIGVILYERRIKLLGLAHVVMPNSMGRTESLGKYADTAIPETVNRMQQVAACDPTRLVAKLAGGANMFSSTTSNSSFAIGDQNLEAVEASLKKLGISVVARHVGGTAGRRMVVDAATGTARVFVLGCEMVEI
jgi:chemotaxis protein CheD